MMNINEWRLLKESIGGGLNLGLSRPNVIGGPIGSRFSEEKFKADDADFDDEDEDEEDDYDGEQVEDEDDEEGMEGDLIGSTKKNDGPPKSFPPDDVEDDDSELPDDFGGEGDDFGGGEDDEMDSMMADLDGMDFGGGDDMGGDEFGGMDDMGGEDELAGALGAGMGDEMGGKDLGGDDMDFLNDIDPEMAGMGPEEDGDMGGMDDLGGEDFGGDMGDEMGGDEFGGDSENMGDEPCPDCNPEGTEEMGEEGCPSCNGLGFIPSQEELGSEFGGDEDPFGGDAPAPAPAPDKMMSFQKKYMHKDKDKGREHCNCEQDEFLNSLTKNARNPAIKKNKNGLKEDSLFSLIDPKDVFGEPDAGQVGFAPNSRIGSIGGGYTQDDISDMPVLGEATNHRGGRRKAPAKSKYPTINEWLQHKAKPATKSRSKKRR